MARQSIPNTLKDAPLKYAPENEMGVVYLFAHQAKRLGFDIEEIRAGFPDCLAYRNAGNRKNLVRIEFEFRSSNFRSHKHDPKECDCIVCWVHDWPDAPKRLEIIELRKGYNALPKIWIQPAGKKYWDWLDKNDVGYWSVSKQATPGDLLLMYRVHPERAIHDVFVLTGDLKKSKADWRDGDCYLGKVKRLMHLKSPLHLEDLRAHRIIKTAAFMRRNLQGTQHVSEYWPHLYDMITKRNATATKSLRSYAPSKF